MREIGVKGLLGCWYTNILRARITMSSYYALVAQQFAREILDCYIWNWWKPGKERKGIHPVYIVGFVRVDDVYTL